MEVSVNADIDSARRDHLGKFRELLLCGYRRIVDHEDVLFRVVRISFVNDIDAHLDAELLALIDLPVVRALDRIFGLDHPASRAGDKAAFRFEHIGPYELKIVEAFGSEIFLHLLHRRPPVIVVAARQELTAGKFGNIAEILFSLIDICSP